MLKQRLPTRASLDIAQVLLPVDLNREAALTDLLQ